MSLILMLAIFEGVMGSILFIAAGRLDLPWFWALLAVHTTMMTICVSVIDPELREERRRQKSRVRIIAMPLILAHLVIAGLDAGRFGWSGEIPVAARIAALSIFVCGFGFAIWAMSVNRFFSPAVRIQEERGHQVVASGPYRYLRHPGYAGSIVSSVCGGVVLGSWWSLIPLAGLALVFLIRTAWEDQMLRDKLDGYAAYASRVRYRLLPGVW